MSDNKSEKSPCNYTVVGPSGMQKCPNEPFSSCNLCQANFCREHGLVCQLCRSWICESCSRDCSNCGIVFCSECFTKAGQPDFYPGQFYCDACVDGEGDFE